MNTLKTEYITDLKGIFVAILILLCAQNLLLLKGFCLFLYSSDTSPFRYTFSKGQGFTLDSLQCSIVTECLKDQSKGQKETLRNPAPLTLTQQVCCGLFSTMWSTWKRGSLHRTLVQYLSTFHTSC